MSLLLTWAAACGSAPEPVIRSHPTTPTVAFPEPGAAERAVVWTELEELFPKRPASLPDALAGLVPGITGAAARDLVERAHEPGAKILGNRTDTAVQWSTLIADAPNAQVIVTLDAEGAALVGVDVALPDDVAVPMLTTRWGDPDSVRHQDGGAGVYAWSGDGPWTVELVSEPGGTAMVHYLPAPRHE